jgi:hypothetical protein
VYAHGAGQQRIAFGLTTADNALAFRFRVGDSTYRRLVSTPGLRAFITVDRVGRRSLGVTFRGR